MKKIIAILLMAVLILSLTSCGKPAAESSEEAEEVYPGLEQASKEEREAFAKACELMEQERYGEAMDAFANIPLYDAIWVKLNEIKRLTSEAEASFLSGQWYDIQEAVKTNNAAEIEFIEGNRAIFKESSSEAGIICRYQYQPEINAVQLYYNGSLVYVFTCETVDGIIHLKNRKQDFVPAANYEELKPVIIELTADNWDTYFEIRPWETTKYDHWGEVSYQLTGYAFYLKDEYLERYLQTGDITFYLKSDVSVTDPNNKDTILKVEEDVEIQADLRDYRNNPKQENMEDDFVGYVFADITSDLYYYVPSYYDYRSSAVYTINSFDRVTAEGSFALYP